MGAIAANKYAIEGALGAGGTGVVLAARHLTLSSRRVAIKHLHANVRDDPEVTARFVREAQTAAALSHPHIVEVYDVEQDAALGPLVVMEFLQGKGLDALLRTAGPLAWQRAGRLMLQVLDAVGYAHARGVVHRDLKPANLFVLDAGGAAERIKVLDFGIARIGDAGGLTDANAFVGTPRYASPEQRASAARADARSDVYSLGVTLLEMLAGRPAPVIDGTAAERALQVSAAVGPGAPAELVELVARAIARAPAERFANAAAMRAALADVMRAAGEPVPTPSAVADASPLADSIPPARPSSRPPGAAASSSSSSSSGPAPASPVSTPSDQAATMRARPSSQPSGGAIGTEPTTDARAPRPAGSVRATAPVSAEALPVDTSRDAQPPGVIARRRALVIGAGVLVAATGATTLALGLRARRADDGGAGGEGQALSLQRRAALERAARQWAAAMVARQNERGALAYEPGRISSGWDTGQMLMGLFEARAVCGAPDSAPLLRAVRALDELRGASGWSGVPSPGQSLQETSVATAWVVLALARAAATLGGAEIAAQCAAAREVLLRSQRADGGFAYPSGAAGEPAHPYASVLATWALLDAEPVAPEPRVRDARRRAVAWVRAQLASVRGDPPLRSIAGLADQAAWVLARAGATRADREAGDGALLAGCARDIVERCRLGPAPERACERALVEDGAVPLPLGGQLQMLWFPWAMAAASSLLHAPGAAPSAGAREALRDVVRWGAAQMDQGAPAIALAPGYKLAEYSLALGEILRA